ncbi:MFS transporter [Tessaracoccus sp. MC1679]|uniref:glycoside-pentoside-hexuronide (GPH):cation symporter n=1 Tax=Tessaracoccus sp. MC1679 TaxID=2760313 RepID=UPI0015FF0774|nr:glycoside-pentoside-hexuronide (GPH):cation symporter [Tessaracoccus sp. MC1679]MBB1516177.1 MFS transporter [Tessaracoccus sp. MC1679]
MGRIIDMKKPGRLGKFRPIILWFSVPLLVSSWMLYAAKWIMPDASTTAYTIYMYAFYILMGSVFYTAVNIAYGSMAPSLTQVPTERAKLASFRMYGAALMILALSWVIAPQIRANVGNADALQNSIAISVGILSIIGAGLYLFTVWGTKEQVARDPRPVTMKESFGSLAVNRPLQVLSVAAVFFLLGTTVMGTLGAYIAIYVQNDANYIAINQTAQVAALFLVGPIIPVLVRTMGKRLGYVVVASFMYIGALILWLAPLGTYPWLGSVAFFVMGIAMFGVNTLMWALEADCVEFGEWKIGQRTEGTTYAVFSFTRKMGQALGGFVGGWALGWAGFVAAEVAAGGEVSDEVAGNIRMWAAVFLIGSTLLTQLAMFFYPLTEKKYLEIVGEIAARRAARVDA